MGSICINAVSSPQSELGFMLPPGFSPIRENVKVAAKRPPARAGEPPQGANAILDNRYKKSKSNSTPGGGKRQKM